MGATEFADDRPWVRSVGQTALAFAVDAGAADVERRRHDLTVWQTEVAELGAHDYSTDRGTLLAGNPALCQRLEIDQSAAEPSRLACATVARERDTLSLA